MSESLFLIFLDSKKFANAPALWKCFYVYGVRLNELSKQYTADALLSYIDNFVPELVEVFRTKSITWTGKDIYDLLAKNPNFGKNLKENVNELVKTKFEIVPIEGDILIFRIVDNKILVEFDQAIFDDDEFIDLASTTDVINAALVYKKMGMFDTEFDKEKIRQIKEEGVEKAKALIKNVQTMGSQLVIECTGNEQNITSKARKSIVLFD